MHSWPLHLLSVAAAILIAGCSGTSEPLLTVQSDVSTETDDAELDARRSWRAERNAKTRRQQILAEINKSPSHAWAGEYYAGDGLGVNTTLAIAPRSGYVFEWHGCLGLYDRNYGPVMWANDRIQLSFTFQNKRKGFQGIAPELIPISWGPRRYLVPADEMVGFCNHVNEGQEPRTHRYGFYLLRKGDEKKEVEGFPTVPNEYRTYLLTKPIDAAIISVGRHTARPSVCEWKFKDTPVTINAGTNKGLRVGMELVVTHSSGLGESVRLTKIEENRAEGIMTQIGEDEPAPQPGWQLSTQAPWNKPQTNRAHKKRINQVTYRTACPTRHPPLSIHLID